MMIGGLRHVAWDDPTEAIPAFLTVIIMPLAVSITEGVAFGLHRVRRPQGRRPAARREVHPLMFVFAALFLADTRSSGDEPGRTESAMNVMF